MFKWLKDRYNKYVNDRLIVLYPGMHYRQRKKNAVRLAYKTKLDEINSHIYSYHKGLTKWDSFLILSKQLLQSSKVSLLLEIKHYSKLKNLMHRIKRWLLKIKEFLIVVMEALENILEENQDVARRNIYSINIPIFASYPLNTSAVIDRLDTFHALAIQRKLLMADICIDCGIPFGYYYSYSLGKIKTKEEFRNRWRDPDNPNKHLICSIIGD